jgi:hypothetical protein
MPLSEDDKLRIREEEQYRAQVREDLRRNAAPNDARFIAISLAVIGALVILWNVLSRARLP